MSGLIAGIAVAVLALSGNIIVAVLNRRSSRETGFTQQFRALVTGFETRIAGLEREVKACEEDRQEDRVRIHKLEAQVAELGG